MTFKLNAGYRNVACYLIPIGYTVKKIYVIWSVIKVNVSEAKCSYFPAIYKSHFYARFGHQFLKKHEYITYLTPFSDISSFE